MPSKQPVPNVATQTNEVIASENSIEGYYCALVWDDLQDDTCCRIEN
jgi:hypothetical protein